MSQEKLTTRTAFAKTPALTHSTLVEANEQHAYGVRGAPPAIRLLDKADVLAITNVSFPTIWSWMRAGKFPRSLVVGGKSMWRSDEIDAWLANLPKRVLKGDAEVEVA